MGAFKYIDENGNVVYVVKGVKGDKGNGIASVELNADYTLTLTFDDGTSYTTSSIRGATGSAGKDGSDGTSVTVSSVSESTADGGSNVVTFSDGKTLTVKNGSKGSDGANGANGATYTPDVTEDGELSWTNDGGLKNPPSVNIKGATGAAGYTPVKGTDYYTEADKAEMVSLVKTALTTETWTFTLEDGSTVDKAVLLG